MEYLFGDACFLEYLFEKRIKIGDVFLDDFIDLLSFDFSILVDYKISQTGGFNHFTG